MKEPKGSQGRIIEEVILTRVGSNPVQASTMRRWIEDYYGSFCERNFWRVVRKLRERGVISRVGKPRDPFHGGYVYGRTR